MLLTYMLTILNVHRSVYVMQVTSTRYSRTYIFESAGLASVSSGNRFGDVCSVLLLVWSHLELIMSLGRSFASPKNTPAPPQTQKHKHKDEHHDHHQPQPRGTGLKPPWFQVAVTVAVAAAVVAVAVVAVAVVLLLLSPVADAVAFVAVLLLLLLLLLLWRWCRSGAGNGALVLVVLLVLRLLVALKGEANASIRLRRGWRASRRLVNTEVQYLHDDIYYVELMSWSWIQSFPYHC